MIFALPAVLVATAAIAQEVGDGLDGHRIPEILRDRLPGLDDGPLDRGRVGPRMPRVPGGGGGGGGLGDGGFGGGDAAPGPPAEDVQERLRLRAPPVWGPDHYPMKPDVGPGGADLDGGGLDDAARAQIDGCLAEVRRLDTDFSSARVRAYLDACTSTRDEAQAAGLGPLIDRTVSIRHQRSTLSCTGLMLDERTVLTARHCLLGPDRVQAKLTDRQLRFQLLFLRFRLNFGDGQWREFVSVLRDPVLDGDAEAGVAANDWLALQIDPVGVDLPPLDVVSRESARRASSSSRLVIFGRSRYDDHIRWDKLPSCSIQQVDERAGCFSHRCQTLWGTSGAPIFMFH